MKETKWTPGPWSTPHFAIPDSGCKCGYVLVEDLCGAVATVHYSVGEALEDGDNPQPEQAEANAHLIAAAPELYEALENLLDWAWSEEPSGGPRVVREAATILAKARGEA